MRFEVDIPETVSRRLTERATAAGSDVVSLIRTAVVEFVERDADESAHRRRPDPLPDVVEEPPSVDLPRSGNRQSVVASPGRRRRPDSGSNSE